MFECLRQANLKCRPKKCKLFNHEVQYLGHIVSDKGVGCDPSKIESIKEWCTPKNVTEVQSFLGLASYYRKHILHFSDIASPLFNLTKKGKTFLWNDQCENSFATLKRCLIEAPILSYPTESGQFILDTDASLNGLGAVLSQIQDGEEKVIAYGSKTLNKSQRNYCTTYKELLAVVTFLKAFKHYVWGSKIIVRTDHASLVWLKRFKTPEGMLARWISVVDMFLVDIQHRKGSLHGNADGLSRKPHRACKRFDCPDCIVDIRVNSVDINSMTVSSNDDVVINNDVNWCEPWSNTDILHWQKSDKDLKTFITIKLNNTVKPDRETMKTFPPLVSKLCQLWDQLYINDNGILCRFGDLDEGCNTLTRIVVSQELKSKLMYMLHNDRSSGHLGRDRTLASISKRYFWIGMSGDVKRWCQQCDLCAKRKPGPGRGKAPLQSTLRQVVGPFDKIGIDILGGLHKTRNDNLYIIVVCDYFSKWTEAFAVKDHTAITVADKLCSEMFTRFGVPRQIISDQGREFEGELFKELCIRMGIEKLRTTGYHPQTDGLVERFNRSLIQMLSSFVSQNLNDWDDHLPYVMMAYRASKHETTRMTPNLVVFGRETNLPVDIMMGPPPGESTQSCHTEYVEWLKYSLEKSHKAVYQNTEIAANRQTLYYDRGLKEREFKIGDFVWRWYPPAISNKLGQGWTGPFKIMKKLSSVVYIIQKDISSKPLSIHVDHLKPYQGRNAPNWDLTNLYPNNAVNMSDDVMPDSDVLSLPVDQNFSSQTTSILRSPVRTRVGRTIKPREIYSP